jgi:uncharacterized protein (TIGR00290 family)
MKEKVFFNWSGGKDSAWALYKLQRENEYDVTCLLTSISAQHQRVSMHGVRTELMDVQAESIGLPLVKMELSENPTMEAYEAVVTQHFHQLKAQGNSGSVFGDIFLEDLRAYREQQLAAIGLKGIFPLWKTPTDKLIREFIDAGFKTIVTCVNEKYLDKSFAGRVIDHDFLNDLPAGVDPCGENGEYHTFVFDGPLFETPVELEKGEVVYRKYSAPKQDANAADCFKKNADADDCFRKEEERDDPYSYGFWYCDLTLKIKAPAFTG